MFRVALKKTSQGRKALLAAVICGSLLLSIFLGPTRTTEASVTEDLAQRLTEAYAFIDAPDKSVLQDRQNKVADLTEVNIVKPAYDKLPSAAKAAFGSVDDALEMVKDAGKVYYSPDVNVLKGRLDAYHGKWGSKVAAAFSAVGYPGVKIEDLEELALDTEAEVPGVIGFPALANLINNWRTNPQAVKDQLTAWLKEAIRRALNRPRNQDIKDALAALNLNLDDLVGLKTRLAAAVDAPGYEGEKALAKAGLRSKAVVMAKVNGVDKGVIGKERGKPLNMYVGEKATVELKVFDWAIQDLVNWGVYSGPPDVITISGPTLAANKTGTVEVRAYSYRGDPGADPAAEWICRFDVIVTTAPSPGPGGPPPPAPGKITETIGKDGGSVSLGDTAINIPAGALEKAKDISIERIDSAKAPSAPEGFKFIGEVYDFGPEGLEFRVPVTITFKYDPTKLAGLDEGTLAIHYYDKAKDVWAKLGSTVDKVKRTVSAKVNHFTRFALLAKTEALPPPLYIFPDVPNTHWAAGVIKELCQKEIIGGYPDGTFKPENNITRAEFTKVMVKAMGLAEEKPATPIFKDVASGDWYYGYVEAAAKAGLVKGYETSEFRPNNLITREEIAVILVRALGGCASCYQDKKTTFVDDEDISSGARGSVVFAVKEGLLKGYPDNTLGPKRSATRAEACALVSRFLAKK